MKRKMMLLVFGILLLGTTGCHVTECWNYAWNSRFHPERNAPPVQRVIMVDPGDDACGEGAPMVAPCCH